MLPADCLMKPSADGEEMYMIVQTPSGRKFRIIDLENRGGVGRIYLCVGQDADGNLRRYALKEYPVPATEEMRRQQKCIRANLTSLILDPVSDENGRPLETMVAPIEIIDFPRTGTFGYVMEYVDLENYRTVSQMLGDYPEADVLCRIAKRFTHFFACLAGHAGKSYKDINEGNIYINLTDGDIRIIDNDNVGASDSRTITGTLFYMAPEVQSGRADPDRVTDRFSMAAFLLRLFTGAYPYEGRRALQYAQEHGLSIFDAAPVIFGTEAMFIFDPDCDDNTIRGFVPGPDASEETLRRAEAWQAQCTLWDSLPDSLRHAFTHSLRNGDPARRLTAQQWHEIFCRLEKTVVTCPHCGRKIFGDCPCCPDCRGEIPHQVCRSCGKSTPEGLSRCIHCGENPQSAPQHSILCPHCGAQTPEGSPLCLACGRHIRVTCAKCGAIHPGDAEICPVCRTGLYKPCPLCGRHAPLSARACPHCGSRFPALRRRCAVCGRIALPGQEICIRCGSTLSAHASAPVRCLTVDVTVKSGDSVDRRTLSHRFPAPENACYCGNQLDPRLPDRPLFSLMYHPRHDALALTNRSGKAIRCLTRHGGERAFDLPDGESAVLAPGDIFKFRDSLQIRIDSMR